MIQSLLAFSLLLLPPALFAEEDIFDLAAEYNQIKKLVTNLESEKRKVLAEIYSIERETNLLVIEKNKTNEKKLKLDGELNKISRHIVELETQLQAMVPELMERLNFTEQVQNLPWFYAFLTSQSLADLDHTLQTAQHLNQTQGESVVRFLDIMKLLDDQKAQLNKTAHEIVKTQATIEVKEKKISSNQRNKKRRLKKLENSLATKRGNLRRVKGEGKKALANSLFKDMGLLFGSTFFDQKGRLPHPVKAPVTHGYGLNKGLLPDHIQLVHKGYFYHSNQALKVSSVAGGRVRFAGKVKGYGQVVVVDHGSRYYTTYANLKKVKIKRGQEVKQGAALGSTGHDHLQMGRGAYFEIRHFSQPQNPDQWLEKPKGRLATL